MSESTKSDPGPLEAKDFALTTLGTLVIFRSSNLVIDGLIGDLSNLHYYLAIVITLGIIGIYGALKKDYVKLFAGVISAATELVLGINEIILFFMSSSTCVLYESLFSILAGSLALYFSYKYSMVLRETIVPKQSILQEPKSEYAVELINVIKDYHVGPIVVHALRGVSLKIKRGEFVAIMGPSGSGKSTLLNLIGAIDRPTSGKVLIDGVDISKLDDNELAELRNKKIGFVFQAYNLINRTTVLRNVELPAIVAGVPKKERVKRAKEVLRIVGLEEEIYRSPKYLSGGQQQRVAIARALINNPSIILADEPTGNLDSKTGYEVMSYLRKLNEEFGTTVIVVTHARDVAEMADRILYIRDGKIIGEEILRRGEKR